MLGAWSWGGSLEHKAPLQALLLRSDVPKGLTRRHVMAPKAPEQAGRALWIFCKLVFSSSDGASDTHSVGPWRI